MPRNIIDESIVSFRKPFCIADVVEALAKKKMPPKPIENRLAKLLEEGRVRKTRVDGKIHYCLVQCEKKNRKTGPDMAKHVTQKERLRRFFLNNRQCVFSVDQVQSRIDFRFTNLPRSLNYLYGIGFLEIDVQNDVVHYRYNQNQPRWSSAGLTNYPPVAKAVWLVVKNTLKALSIAQLCKLVENRNQDCFPNSSIDAVIRDWVNRGYLIDAGNDCYRLNPSQKTKPPAR